LRHVLKAKIFCIVCDGSRYNAGIQEVIDLFQEIMEYIDQKFDNPDIDIIKKDDMITLIATKEGEIILEKRIIFLINKYDLINDPEILGEERKIMEEQLQVFFKQRSI
jgi:GTPase involved in cell partitioning and DNA repair